MSSICISSKSICWDFLDPIPVLLLLVPTLLVLEVYDLAPPIFDLWSSFLRLGFPIVRPLVLSGDPPVIILWKAPPAIRSWTLSFRASFRSVSPV